MSSIGRRVASASVSNQRLGIKAKSSFKNMPDGRKGTHLDITKNHPALVNTEAYSAGQQRLEIIGTKAKTDFLAPPKYKNIATTEAINAQLRMILQNPDAETLQALQAAITQTDHQSKRKVPRNQQLMFQAAQQRGYNQVSNIGVQMPNAPMGVPVAESYLTTGDDEALAQMQNPNPSEHYADMGGPNSFQDTTPPACYIQDPISGAKTRQGGYSYYREVPYGAGNHPETYIRHNAAAPLPRKEYLPAMNLAGPGQILPSAGLKRPGP